MAMESVMDNPEPAHVLKDSKGNHAIVRKAQLINSERVFNDT